MENHSLVNDFRKYLYLKNANIKLDRLEAALSSEGYRNSSEVLELFNGIAEICANRDERFFKPLPRGTIIYRARTVMNIDEPEIQTQGIAIDDSTKGYNEINSREAPLGLSPSGRNNITGVSYFYGARNPATACAELKSPVGTIISVAEFELLQNITLFDFIDEKKFSSSETNQKKMALGKYWGYIMFLFQRPIVTDADYRITQIIAEEIRKQGCDGLSYSSFYGDGENLTLFHCGSNILSFKNSRLVRLMYSNQIYWDYNNSGNFESYSKPQDYNYSEKDARIQLNKIKQSWERNSNREEKVGNENG